MTPALPTKFPCWCRAIYSWGGESKRDLGFVEGDLIECLNAGDGSWWMGRLRRDKRMMGLFPSNFVVVLGEDFVPVTRSTTDALTRNDSADSRSLKKQRTVFRKPFQAHRHAVTPGEANRRAREKLSETPSTATSRENTPPRSILPQKPPRTPTTAIRARNTLNRPPSQTVSPSPAENARAPSPVPQTRDDFVSTAPSYPVPSKMTLEDVPYVPPQPPVREASPSPPPPPPPPHRVAVRSQQHRMSIAPTPIEMNNRYTVFAKTPPPRETSPLPPSLSPGHSPGHSPGGHSSVGHGNTPSPLRDAMEDVMTSLQDMGLPRGAPSPSPTPQFSNPWSPDAYNEIRATSPRPARPRANTSLGFGLDSEEDIDHGVNRFDEQQAYGQRYYDGPPQFNNYVQRMESRLRQLHDQSDQSTQDSEDDVGPPPPPKQHGYHARHDSIGVPRPQLRARKSAVELGKQFLNRTMTNKSNTTNSSSGVQSTFTTDTTSTNTTASLMSGTSAGQFSATSAGSFARHGQAKWGSFSAERPTTGMDSLNRGIFSDLERPLTPISGISYHSSHNTSRQGAQSAVPWSPSKDLNDSPGVFGGLSTPKVKKNGFLKRFLESAKTGAATARSSIQSPHSGGSPSPTKHRFTQSFGSSRRSEQNASQPDLGTSSSIDWVQVRRDVNRASTPSRNERIERAERCQMMDHPVIYAVEELYETAEGDESIDGLPLSEPTNWGAINLNLVDKSTRFISSLPPLTNPASLAQGYICRPYKSDVQRLRAIFIWVSEKIAWEEPLDENEVDLKRVINMKRGCPQDVAFLVQEMCSAVGLHADIIKGYLKSPGELLDLTALSRPNHWWNAILIDGEWRFMDCSLASPTNPKRSQFVTTNSQHAESWYFLARPLEICYTHIPLHPEEQHICPPISPDVLLALPPVSPAFFKNSMQIPNYDTSHIRIEGLDIMQLRILVPPDVECAAEVEAPAFARDVDGDWFESGDVVRKRALAQPDWIRGQKRFTIKALLPGDEGQGVLKIYAGKKGLMHSSRDIPHPLAVTLPILHTGENPPYEFLLRHPTPHAQRHDLYVIQPQCGKLAINNTFVFAVRQHPAAPFSKSSSGDIPGDGRVSPSIMRPSSALSMVSSSYGGSVASSTSLDGFTANTSVVSSSKSTSNRDKPAKLAIQSPSGKILRLMRKADHMISTTNENSDSLTEGTPDGSVWETVIKIGERGVWRGLVLADRSARWCVFCEWESY
ncbi:SH3 domain protein (Cyk3), putative [Talaromyces stipitatus ATCC 10500]|uniref:SH3 domain protein (Cyk3), putative n=1 Tax=Talaromyces stipitatus (strain ATCC 10500 / CBS 375.48 / QM 6759 / NRRL 1006) TaxID=441959 RepID=B8MDC8_TALSN|nr:SH3 domain protein (Cyk3), putative [Talaromyces stipitatus ATCC 10500]EED17891.1 SH3 domain protein (Cyk3), putative [Talaromyces stipitatus ATCC 10500]